MLNAISLHDLNKIKILIIYKAGLIKFDFISSEISIYFALYKNYVELQSGVLISWDRLAIILVLNLINISLLYLSSV